MKFIDYIKSNLAMDVFALAIVILGGYLIVSNIGWGAFIGIFLLLWANNIDQGTKRR